MTSVPGAWTGRGPQPPSPRRYVIHHNLPRVTCQSLGIEEGMFTVLVGDHSDVGAGPEEIRIYRPDGSRIQIPMRRIHAVVFYPGPEEE